MRDKIAVSVASFILTTFASREYVEFQRVVTALGLERLNELAEEKAHAE